MTIRQPKAILVLASDTLLFNLKTDVGEKSNLVKTDSEEVKELLAAWKTYEKNMGKMLPALVQRMPADNSHITKRAERAKKTGL